MKAFRHALVPTDFETKVIKVCPDCGADFVDYCYHKLLRCPECRARRRKEDHHGEEPKQCGETGA